MFRILYILIVGVVSMCGIWTSLDVIIPNEVSGKEKSLKNLTLNIFTSNLHILSQSVSQTRIFCLKHFEIFTDARYVKKLAFT